MEQLDRLKTRLSRGALNEKESAAACRICQDASERITQLTQQVEQLLAELEREQSKPSSPPSKLPAKATQKVLLTDAFPTGIALGCGFWVATAVAAVCLVIAQVIGITAIFQ